MHLLATALLALVALTGASPTPAGLPILMGNDDGWAEANIRTFYAALKAAGHIPMISAPAENKSGSGSLSATPTNLTSEGEFGSIPAGAPGVGHDAVDDHIWYVNAYPADGIRVGLANLTDPVLGGVPALVTTGPNVGGNAGLATLFSGTVGAASFAVTHGVPAVAFSGASGSQRSINDSSVAPGDYSALYAAYSVQLLTALVAAGPPYLPAGAALNVNFPAAGAGTDCAAEGDVKFVLSRVHTALGLPIDVQTCGSSALPTESSVLGTGGACYASVSVFNGSTKLDAGKDVQAVVLARLASLFTCLP